jgi:cytochrome c oxidase subunit 2
VDELYLFLIGVSVFFTALIFLLLLYFAIKYRRRSEDEQPHPVYGSLLLEVMWMVIPFLVVMIMFVWGARLYFASASPPGDALEIHVVGKQWMWYFQHPDGQRAINELHVPVGRPVKLTMVSQDVIHNLYVPAFRIKMDVGPTKYTTTWFEATKTGTFQLFCLEYCGAAHAGMIGQVVVMTPTEYAHWLERGTPEETLVRVGAGLFQSLGCSGCHAVNAAVRAPPLTGLYGKPVPLASGAMVIADDSYIRDSILLPQQHITAGYLPLMPSYQGRISEEEILMLLAYIKSLGAEPLGQGMMP